MLLNKTAAPITLKNDLSSFSFLSGGDSFLWMHDSVMINAFCGNSLNGSQNNLYLRIFQDGKTIVRPLTGRLSESCFSAGIHSLEWKGSAERIEYAVTFRLTPYGIWFWDIRLKGCCPKADVIYSQDIGCASYGSILSNELYTAQYLGHSVFSDEAGYTICSRQNISQDGKYPYIQQGCLNMRTVSYSTDGTQFYGLAYKKTDTPEALSAGLLGKNEQFELSHTALQTEVFSLNGEKRFSFYGLCRADHPKAVTKKEFSEELIHAFNWQPDDTLIPSPTPRPLAGVPFASPEWDENQISAHFPKRCLEEYAPDNKKLYSFFTPENSHVVLQAKELVSQRPHGHILMTGFSMDKVPHGVVSSSNYMYGIFNCQFVAGNTNMNRFLSNHRGLLNVDKSSGQRIYVRINGTYRCLTLPSAYEMDIAGSTWYYQMEDDALIIRSYAVFDRPETVLSLRSEKGRNYDFIVTHRLTAGPDEFGGSVLFSQEGDILTVKPSEDCATYGHYPKLCFTMRLPSGSVVSDDRVFFSEEKTCDSFLLTVSVPDRDSFTFVLQGTGQTEALPFLTHYSFQEQKNLFHSHYKKLLCSFYLQNTGNGRADAEKLNTVTLWYAHDALIHFASPHGLEQSGGAAWGTRDVCQGPMEFFLTFGHFSMARDILIHLFSHQLYESAQWPQWFMFDRYPIHQEDCHGDVIFWPLKALSDYIAASGDCSVLKEITDYRNATDALPSGRPETILSHVKRCISTIQTRFLPGTFLISYAGGDWDDTLQPADSRLKDSLVSAWTQALAAQTLCALGGAVKSADIELSRRLHEMSAEISRAFNDYLIKDGVIAGFLCLAPDGSKKYILHPKDRETGIHYRLLPLTRSIISQLADDELAEKNIGIIDRHLTFPDGVRLMDRPTVYSGGVSRIFMRAEQAANIGREISLQYVHAHIRYIEAMAVCGRREPAWDAIMKINPILLSGCVHNALPRQSNVYFSSSDGCFSDRYEYTEAFDLLKSGKIAVRGGWRLYSSGPGIYIRRLTVDLLGIHLSADGILIDPVMPPYMDKTCLTLECFGRTVTFYYHIGSVKPAALTVITGSRKAGMPVKNRYRDAGVMIERQTFLDDVAENPVVHIFIDCDTMEF